MPVDASIYSIGAERPKSMLEYQAEFEDRDTRRQSNNLLMQGQRQKLDEYGRAIRSQESMRNRLQSLAPDASDDDRANALYAEGTPEAIAMAEKLRKAADDSRKTKSSTLKDDVDSENKVVAAYRDMIGMVSDPQAAAQLVTVMHSDPRLKNTPMARVPLEQGLAQIGQDPQAFAAWKQQFGLGATKYIEQNKPQYITQNLGGTSQITALPGLGGPGTVASSSPITQSPDNIATVGATIRGQDLINARAREQAADARTQAAGQVTYQTDGEGNLVALPTRAAAGTVIRAQPVVGSNGMMPIPGKDGGLTEGQSKALSFGARMKQNRAVIEELEKGGTFNRGGIKATAETIGRVAGLGTDTFGGTLAEIGGTATNWTQSEAQQRYETAKRNWIAANLRKESGAVIGTDEYRQADSQYFPQPGDDAKTKADKARLRATAEKTMLEEVPRGKRPTAGAAPSAAPAAPSVVMKFDAQGNLLP
jgi:hypothetical protein